MTRTVMVTLSDDQVTRLRRAAQRGGSAVSQHEAKEFVFSLVEALPPAVRSLQLAVDLPPVPVPQLQFSDSGYRPGDQVSCSPWEAAVLTAAAAAVNQTESETP
ncbi:MAG: hypothetical protein ACRCW4_00440 [Candidatus Neomicrothrix subdominans]